jgi:dolichyl-phosphate-mannose-protein mannosyltransferase
MTPSAPPLRREIVVVAALTILGAVLRLWSFGRLGLQHFDEGIYALSGLWPLTAGGLAAIDSTLISYAPPGFTVLIGLAYAALGVSDLAAIAVSIACGIASVPIAAWLGRRTFGPGGGAAAAAFASLSGSHVAFSRMALTDAPFLLSWLLSMGLGSRFLECPRLGRSLAFGLAVGLAQNFKYNGWLAGAMVGVVAVLDLAFGRMRDREQIARMFGFGVVAAIVATLLYLPWFQFVETHGGYASLLAHHRSYMGGFSTWLPHARLQLDQSVALSGGPFWGLTAWAAARLGSAYAAHNWSISRSSNSQMAWVRFVLGLLGGMAALAALPTIAWWVGFGWCVGLLRDSRPSTRLLGVWWLVLSIATPFYHPYARLWLPLHAAGWLLLAGLISRLDKPLGVAESPIKVRPPCRLEWAIVAALVIGLSCWQQFGTADRAHPLRGLLTPSDSLRTIVSHLNDPQLGAPPHPSAVQALARPPFLFYYVTGGGRLAYRTHPNFDSLCRAVVPNDLVVIDEVLLRQEPPGSQAQMALSRLASYPAEYDELNIPTLLDLEPAAAYSLSIPGRTPGSLFRAGGVLQVRDTNRSVRIWLLTGRDFRTVIAP